MRIIDRINYKVKEKYGLAIRPLLNRDLGIIFRANEHNYPFNPYPDQVQLLNALKWLFSANKKLGGRGLPAKFYLLTNYGLSTPYPETTGYTLCTLLAILRNRPWEDFNYNLVKNLIKNCYKFLLSMRLESGAFTGSRESMPDFGVPSVFDTGQILLGLTDLYQTARDHKELVLDFVDLKDLEKTISGAADFLTGQMEEEGSFKNTYTYLKSKRTYYARVAYGLLRVGIVLGNEKFINRAKRNFDYAVAAQQESGWIDRWGFSDDYAVLHTIAYTLRGLAEAAIYFEDPKYATAVKKGMDFLVGYEKIYFRYPNLLPSHYNSRQDYTNDLCLTGLSQIAIVIKKFNSLPWITTPEYEKLFSDIITATKRFQMRGFNNKLLNGAMPASWPLQGEYQPYKLIEWGVKFFMDSLLLSLGVPGKEIRG